jgi:hypothetical protein
MKPKQLTKEEIEAIKKAKEKKVKSTKLIKK